MQRALSTLCAAFVLGVALYLAGCGAAWFVDCLDTGNWPTTGEHGPENADW
jgi:hypothetical protein